MENAFISQMEYSETETDTNLFLIENALPAESSSRYDQMTKTLAIYKTGSV